MEKDKKSDNDDLGGFVEIGEVCQVQEEKVVAKKRGSLFEKFGEKFNNVCKKIVDKPIIGLIKKIKGKDEKGKLPEEKIRGFGLVDKEDKDLLNVKEMTELINEFYNEGKMVSIKKKREKRLLKTIIRKGVPKSLRVHAYLVFFGGFHHLKGQRYEGQIDFQKIIYEAENETDEDKIEENEGIMIQIDKDMIRTHFPQEKKIKKFENLWGINLSKKEEKSFRDYKKEGEDEDKIPQDVKRALEDRAYLTKMAKKVLFAFSKVDPEIGYVQGMNSIASALVYNVWLAKKEKMKSEKKAKFDGVFGQDAKGFYNVFKHLDFDLKYDEEEVFFIFYGLMKYSNQRKFFSIGMSDLQAKISAFEIYLSHELPDVYQKMCGSTEIPLIAYVASFYLTILLHICPMKVTGKVIDIFMLLEYEAIDHLLLGLLQRYEKKILAFDNPVEVLEFFKFDLLKECLKTDNIGAYINPKSLETFLG